MKTKHINIIVILLLSVFTITANAVVCKITPGRVMCGAGKVNTLAGNGMVRVNGTTVLKDTVVNGLFKAYDATFFSLQINGSSVLTKCIVLDEVNVKGGFTAVTTQFKKGVHVYSNTIKLNNSKLNGNLYVYQDDTKKEQFVYLNNKTVVAGDIIFDGGNGEVIISGKSKFTGKVVGGKVSYQ